MVSPIASFLGSRSPHANEKPLFCTASDGNLGGAWERGYFFTASFILHNTYQVSGGHDRVIHVWDVETSTHLHTFTGHRDSISVGNKLCSEETIPESSVKSLLFATVSNFVLQT